MSKSTKTKRPIGSQSQTPLMSQQMAGLDTPVLVPLGTIQAMSEFINKATGPCQLAMQIIQSLQMSVDRAGLGRQAAEAREK